MFANQKAIRHYRRAAELLRQAPAGRERDASELAIRAAMAAPLNAQYGYASTELQARPRACPRPGRAAGRHPAAAAQPGGAVRRQFRAGAHRGVLRDRQAQPGAEPPAPRRHRAGALRGGRVGHQPGAARAVAARTSPWPTSCATTTVHRTWSAPASRCTRGPGPRTPCGCSAATRRRCTGATGRSRGPRR